MKILSVFLALILAMSLSVPALAEETQPTELQTEPVPTETDPTGGTVPTESEPPTVLPTEPVVPTSLEIDTVHLYEGMERSYETGYIPKVSGGTVQIVLPLKALGTLRDNRIKASLDLGTGANLPFVAANYEKDFPLESVLPQNAVQKQEIYLISFEVALAKDRINGTYPVTVRISAFYAANQPLTMDYTVFVTITDGRSGKPRSDRSGRRRSRPHQRA